MIIGEILTWEANLGTAAGFSIIDSQPDSECKLPDNL